tara:strand:- start:31 stop:1263 length:1233 start_codon:yes stop_codon:yes gene_type:complete
MTDETYKKTLNFYDVVLATIGYIVGAGIFAVIGTASKYGKQFTWLAVILCLLLVIPTGMSYSELASIFKTNGGQYYYVKETMNDELALISGYTMIITQILSLTAITFAISNYASTIIKIPKFLFSSIILIFLAFVNYCGIRNSMLYNHFCTFFEITVLLLIILFGFKNISPNMFDISEIKKTDITNIIFSAAILSFAFVGFEITTELTEETINAEKNIPLALMTGVTISALLYFFIIITSISNIGWKKLSTSAAPLAEVANKILGGIGHKLVFIIAILSMSNNILIGHISTTRTIQAMARAIKMPFNLSKIDKSSNTPLNAIIFVTLISLFGLCMGNLENSVIITNITTLILFLFVNISVILLRIQKPNIERKFKIPFSINNIPLPTILGIFSSLTMLVLLITKPSLLKK